MSRLLAASASALLIFAGVGSTSIAGNSATTWTVSLQAADPSVLNYVSLFNAAGSGKVVKIQRVLIGGGIDARTSGITHMLERTTSAGAGCKNVVATSVAPTSVAPPRQISALTACITVPVVAFSFFSCSARLEEGALIDFRPTVCYEHAPGSQMQPITLRRDEGLLVRQRHTFSAPGGIDYMIVFTVEEER